MYLVKQTIPEVAKSAPTNAACMLLAQQLRAVRAAWLRRDRALGRSAGRP
jgi:hypothetical protein